MIRKAAIAILFATSLCSHAAEEAAAKADPAKGKVIAETICVACHGADGNSVIPANPILASQGAPYIYKQLKNFKSENGNPPVRNNAITLEILMARLGLVEGVSEAGLIASLDDDLRGQ